MTVARPVVSPVPVAIVAVASTILVRSTSILRAPLRRTAGSWRAVALPAIVASIVISSAASAAVAWWPWRLTVDCQSPGVSSTRSAETETATVTLERHCPIADVLAVPVVAVDVQWDCRCRRRTPESRGRPLWSCL